MDRSDIELLQRSCVSLQMCLNEDSPLRGDFQGGDVLSMLTDRSIFPHVAQHHEWHFKETRFVDQACTKGAYHLIDIGANIGLFTRQILINFPQVKSATCFEPSPRNVDHLDRNLIHLSGARTFGFGLHNVDGELPFYEDTKNGGNFSFNEKAVAGRAHVVTEVPVRKITEELMNDCMGLRALDRRVIWKSDTQGLDETLMTALPLGFWDRVDLAFFEGWRIKKPGFDLAAFEAILRKFDYIYSMGANKTRVRRASVDETMAYLIGEDRKWADFFLAHDALK